MQSKPVLFPFVVHSHYSRCLPIQLVQEKAGNFQPYNTNKIFVELQKLDTLIFSFGVAHVQSNKMQFSICDGCIKTAYDIPHL